MTVLLLLSFHIFPPYIYAVTREDCIVGGRQGSWFHVDDGVRGKLGGLGDEGGGCIHWVKDKIACTNDVINI